MQIRVPINYDIKTTVLPLSFSILAEDVSTVHSAAKIKTALFSVQGAVWYE